MKEKTVYVIINSYTFLQQKKEQILGKALLFQYHNSRDFASKEMQKLFQNMHSSTSHQK